MAYTARLGKAVVLENKNKKKFSNADSEYTAILVKIEGEIKTLLLTDGELKSALNRATKNPEDVLKQSFISKLLD